MVNKEPETKPEKELPGNPYATKIQPADWLVEVAYQHKGKVYHQTRHFLPHTRITKIARNIEKAFHGDVLDVRYLRAVLVPEDHREKIEQAVGKKFAEVKK